MADTERVGAMVRVPILEARREFGKVLGLVLDKKQRVMLTRHGTEVAAIVPPGDLDAIRAEGGDVPADELADYVLQQFPKGHPTAEQVERWATEAGAILSRSCSGKSGETRFNEVWRVLTSDPRAAFDWASTEPGVISDPCKSRFPHALMRVLRRERQLFVESEAQSLRTELSDRDSRQSVFARIIGMDLKKWARPIALIHDLGVKLQEARAQEDRPLLPLMIGQSGYHEERILARLACDLFLTVHGYAALQIAQAPWAFGRTVDDTLSPVLPEGKADIRLFNEDARERLGIEANHDEKVDDAVIFRHVGYRAYANGAWLANLTKAGEAPEPVNEWINSVRNSGVSELPRLDLTSFPERYWILMKGNPVNYQDTEFSLLFDYLRGKFLGADPGFNGPPVATPESSSLDPDDVFDDFLKGERVVLMGGSIHDLLLDGFWTPFNKTFVKIMDQGDFSELSAHIKRPAGQNGLMFSPRVWKHGPVADLIREIYRELGGIVNSIHRGPAEAERATLTYIATILAPGFHENWTTIMVDSGWSFAASGDGIRQLLREMEVPRAGASAGTR